MAWWLAAAVTGDPRPVFAAITAIVALAPGLPNPRLQMIGFIVGIGTGLVVGELARSLIGDDSGLMIVPVVLVAIVAAATLGRNPLTLIQAGASAVLVFGTVAPDAGRMRLVDALIGGLVAAAFSQIFFAPDPVPMIERSVRRLADAGERLLSAAGETRARRWGEAEDLAAEFEQAAAVARGVRRWTLRGRLDAARIAAAEARWLTAGRRLSAATSLACLSEEPEALRQLDQAARDVRALLLEGMDCVGIAATGPGESSAVGSSRTRAAP